MAEFIAFVIFLASTLGLGMILYKKVPALAQLPQPRSKKISEGFLTETEEKIKDFYSLVLKQKLLHKLLSWIKCLTMKIETRIDALLHGIRKTAKEQKLNKKK